MGPPDPFKEVLTHEVPETTLDQVAGCLRYAGEAKWVAEMDAAIGQEVMRRHKEGRY